MDENLHTDPLKKLEEKVKEEVAEEDVMDDAAYAQLEKLADDLEKSPTKLQPEDVIKDIG